MRPHAQAQHGVLRVALNLITALLDSVDKIGATYVENAYTALASDMVVPGTNGALGAGQLMLVLYVIYWGYEVWSGTARGTPTEIFWRLFRVFVIWTFAQQWYNFQFYVYNFLENVPNAIGNAIVGSMNVQMPGGAITSANGVASQLDNILGLTLAGITSFTAQAHWWNFLLDLMGVVVYAVVLFLVGYAAFLVILAKLFTWILLALAPIILLLALFRVTAIIVANWVKLLLEYFFLQILVYAFLAFFLTLSQSYFAALAQTVSGSTGALWSDLLPIVLVGIIGFFLLTQLQVVAGSLVGIQSFQRGYLGQAWRLAAGATGVGIAAGVFARDRSRGFTAQDRNAVRSEVRRDHYKQTAAYKAMVDKLRDSGKMSGQGTAAPGSTSSSSGVFGAV